MAIDDHGLITFVSADFLSCSWSLKWSWSFFGDMCRISAEAHAIIQSLNHRAWSTWCRGAKSVRLLPAHAGHGTGTLLAMVVPFPARSVWHPGLIYCFAVISYTIHIGHGYYIPVYIYGLLRTHLLPSFFVCLLNLWNVFSSYTLTYLNRFKSTLFN